jgi:hypothetical protein
VGYVFTSPQPNLAVPGPFMPTSMSGFDDSSEMRKNFFAPQPGVAHQFSILAEWVGFFIALLMSPCHFEKANEIM